MTLSRGFLGTTWAPLAITGSLFAGAATAQATTDKIVGNTNASHYWYQQRIGDCEESAFNNIYGQTTGHRMTELHVDTAALALGVLAPTGEGSNWYALPTLGHHFGIKITLGTHTTKTLESDLAAGDKVIAAVNAETIWSYSIPGQFTANDYTSADHALVVDQINETRGTVTLTDSGPATGALETVPLSVFRAAWALGGYNLAVAP